MVLLHRYQTVSVYSDEIQCQGVLGIVESPGVMVADLKMSHKLHGPLTVHQLFLIALNAPQGAIRIACFLLDMSKCLVVTALLGSVGNGRAQKERSSNI